jgi:hypothetical protein
MSCVFQNIDLPPPSPPGECVPPAFVLYLYRILFGWGVRGGSEYVEGNINLAKRSNKTLLYCYDEPERDEPAKEETLSYFLLGSPFASVSIFPIQDPG